MKPVSSSSTASKTSTTVSTSALFGYFLPELVTVSVLYIGLEIINFSFLAYTEIELGNATLFLTNSLFHLITKVAEGFSVGLVILSGNHNGARDFTKAGRVFTDAFWTTALFGAVLSIALFHGAHVIYAFYEAPQQVVDIGVPYLQIRSISIFISFIYFAIIGFLRGIKNPQTPMMIFLMGAGVYLFFDYALIFGRFGFPALGLKGSAIATVIQYAFMLFAALLYILLHSDLHKYNIRFFSRLRFSTIHELFELSWPVMVDKASMALSPIWLNKMIGLTAKLSTVAAGKMMLDSYTVLKMMEKVGILPALAFAQVVTYLVSNDMALKPIALIKDNIKKVLFIACILVGCCTFLFCLKPQLFLTLLNKQNSYNVLMANTLPLIALLIIFDAVQIVLSAALRGASQVKTVMMARLLVTSFIFIPFTYGICHLPIANPLFKFMLLYSSAHLSFAIMGFIYIYVFKNGSWKRPKHAS